MSGADHDEHTRQFTKPLPPKPFRQDIITYILFGKVWGQRARTPRPLNRFRERELARAMRVAKREGGERVEIDPVSGKISVTIAEPSGGPQARDAAVREWDEATAAAIVKLTDRRRRRGDK